MQPIRAGSSSSAFELEDEDDALPSSPTSTMITRSSTDMRVAELEEIRAAKLEKRAPDNVSQRTLRTLSAVEGSRGINSGKSSVVGSLNNDGDRHGFDCSHDIGNGTSSHEQLPENVIEKYSALALSPADQTLASTDDDAPAPISVLVVTLSGRIVSLQVSPADAVAVLLQSLAETTETCHTTCYTLQMEVFDGIELEAGVEFTRDASGVRLIDVASCDILCDLKPPVSEGQRFRMVASRYDEVDARVHVRVLRSILAGPVGPGQLDGPSACLFPLLDPLSGGAMRTGHFTGSLPQQPTSRASAAKTAAAVLSAAKQVASASVSSDETSKCDVGFDGLRLLPYLDMSLESFFPSASTAIECIARLEYSGFNPPPGYRAMQGDLFYLEVETLENHKLCVTAHIDGFFVNKSTFGSELSSTSRSGSGAGTSSVPVFAPAPSMKQIHSSGNKHHSLAGLLSAISPAFKENFALMLSTRTDRDPFEVYPAPEPAVRCWLADSATQRQHIYDPIRAEDFLAGRPSHLGSAGSSSWTSHGIGGNGVNTNDGMQLRNDWNEEYQTARELPAGTVKQRVIRDHAVVGVNNDFVAAATKGAELIISGVVPPLNPHDPLPVQMFIYNNIFFSCAIDTANRHEEVDGRYTYRTANNDLRGVEAYSTLQQHKLRELYERAESQHSKDSPPVEIPLQLCTLATAIIDFRGWRVVAQSMIPGIFNPSTKLHGPAELAKDPGFSRLLQEAAEVLYIRPHDVYASDGTEFDFRPYLAAGSRPVANDSHGSESVYRVFCSAPTKGIVGNDGRCYLIDLCRVTPTDAAVIQRESKLSGSDLPYGVHSMAVLRLELLDILAERQFNQRPDKQKFSLNSDAFSSVRLAGTTAENEADENDVVAASQFMTDVLIPNMVLDFCHLMAVPVDGDTLTAIMHHRGINLRYLGRVAKEAEKVANAHIITLCRREMVARAAKHLLRSVLSRTATGMAVAAPIAHFFNCLFGAVSESTVNAATEFAENARARRVSSPHHSLGLASTTLCTTYPVGIDSQRSTVHLASGYSTSLVSTSSGKKTSRRGGAPCADAATPTTPLERSSAASNIATKAAVAFLGSAHDGVGRASRVKGIFSTHTLWQEIIRLVREGFDYDIPTHLIPPCNDYALTSIPVLRSVCRKVGVRVRARTYDLSRSKGHSEPFGIEDIVGIHPVVKHTQPRTQDGHDLLELGVVAVAEGKLELAFELLSEALVIFSQVYGPMHPATAACFANLAMVLYQSGDAGEAAIYQLKACIISERVLGLDHHETAQNYGNLALFSHKHGRAREALAYMSRALFLGALATGEDHPDNCTSFANLGLVLQELGAINESLTYLKMALEASDRTGEQLALASKLRAESAGKLIGQASQPELIAAAEQDHSLLRAAICHAMATNYSSLAENKVAYQFERMRGDILARVLGEDSDLVEQSALLQKQFIERACTQQRAGRGRRSAR